QGKLSGTGSSVHDSGIEEEGRRRRTTAGTRMRRIQGRNADPLTRRRRSNSITAPPLGEHPTASNRTRPEELRRRGKVEAASEKRVAFDRERSAASRRGPRRGSEPPAGDDARPRARRSISRDTKGATCELGNDHGSPSERRPSEIGSAMSEPASPSK